MARTFSWDSVDEWPKIESVIRIPIWAGSASDDSTASGNSTIFSPVSRYACVARNAPCPSSCCPSLPSNAGTMTWVIRVASLSFRSPDAIPSSIFLVNRAVWSKRCSAFWARNLAFSSLAASVIASLFLGSKASLTTSRRCTYKYLAFDSIRWSWEEVTFFPSFITSFSCQSSIAWVVKSGRPIWSTIKSWSSAFCLGYQPSRYLPAAVPQ